MPSVRSNAVQLIVGLATLATFVVTIMWMYRIATNVRAFQRQTTWSPLFAIFGWMLPPFVLYVIPFLMLRELWKASDASNPEDPESWRSSKDTPLVWAWFVLYGIAPVVLLAVLGRVVPRRRAVVAEASSHSPRASTTSVRSPSCRPSSTWPRRSCGSCSSSSSPTRHKQLTNER